MQVKLQEDSDEIAVCISFPVYYSYLCTQRRICFITQVSLGLIQEEV